MLVMPSGERRWPLLSSANIEELLSLAPIRQYQFRQKGLDRIELRLAVARPLTPGDEDRIADWIRTKFTYPFQVSFSYFDEIPRTAAGKFEDFVCELDSRALSRGREESRPE